MNRIWNLLRQGGQTTYNLYDLFHSNFFQIISYAFLVSLVAIGLNFAGLKIVNATIGCILPIVIAFLASRPEVIIRLLGIGIAKQLRHPIAGTTDVVKLWAGFVGAVLLYLSVFFLIAGTVQFSRNPAAIPVIYLSLIVLFLIGVVWGMKTVIAKKLVYWYAVAVFVVTFGSLISGSMWDKMVGFDPYFVFRVSPVDDAIYDFEELERNQAEESVAERIEVITKKLKKEEKVDTEDRKFLRQQKEERDQRRIPARISKKVSGWVSSAHASTVTASSQRDAFIPWEVTIQPTQLGKVYKNNVFKYRRLCQAGFWIIYEDGSEFYHNPSSQPGEVWKFYFPDVKKGGEIIRIRGEQNFPIEFKIEKI